MKQSTVAFRAVSPQAAETTYERSVRRVREREAAERIRAAAPALLAALQEIAESAESAIASGSVRTRFLRIASAARAALAQVEGK